MMLKDIKHSIAVPYSFRMQVLSRIVNAYANDFKSMR